MPVENEDLKKIVLEYLRRHNTMTLATVHNNIPWAATVFYAEDGFTFYFISNPNVCLHCLNIAHNPRVAITIDEDYALRSQNDWRRVKGVQMEGTAELVADWEEINQAVTAYAVKYPWTSTYLKSVFSSRRVTSLLSKAAAKLKFVSDFTASMDNRFYKVTPTKVWFVDNETSFEKRQEVPF
ncbi:hypothetical protein ES708_14600 [subsurface metagenome]